MRRIVIITLVLLMPASAWAEGWVLIAAPMDLKSDLPIPNAPIREWTQIAAFSTAESCEYYRTGFDEGVTKANPKIPKLSPFISRCMPYDLWWQSQQQPQR